MHFVTSQQPMPIALLILSLPCHCLTHAAVPRDYNCPNVAARPTQPLPVASALPLTNRQSGRQLQHTRDCSAAHYDTAALSLAQPTNCWFQPSHRIDFTQLFQPPQSSHRTTAVNQTAAVRRWCRPRHCRSLVLLRACLVQSSRFRLVSLLPHQLPPSSSPAIRPPPPTSCRICTHPPPPLI